MRRSTRPVLRRARGTAGEKAIENNLHRFLSDKEAKHALAVSLLILDEPGRTRLLSRIGGDTAVTLERLLEAKPTSGGPSHASPGAGRTHQAWNQAWSKWAQCISESQREDGRFVRREDSSEPPFLDLGAVAADLDRIALRMRPLFPGVIEQDLEPELSFATALVEAARQIGSGLPEWMASGGDEGLCFGREVTRCLLEWEWSAGRRRGEGAFLFAERICRLESSLGEASLDSGSLTQFLLGLGEPEQRDILQGLLAQGERPPWLEALGEPDGEWPGIYRELLRKWDRPRYLDFCRDALPEDWRLALPLVSDLVQQKAFAAAVPVLDQAMHSKLRLVSDETWDPRQALLLGYLGFWGWDEEATRQLIELWGKVAIGLGQTDLASVLELQTVVLNGPDDWDAVIEAFRRLGTLAGAEVADRLFAHWRRLLVARTLQRGQTAKDRGEAGWLEALVDLARADGSPEAFQSAVRDCLRKMDRPTAIRDSYLRSLSALTLDVVPREELKRQAPTLCMLVTVFGGGDLGGRKARRRWVERLGGRELLPEVIAFWKRNAECFAPNPAKPEDSDYRDCALWLRAIHELDPKSYRRVLEAWYTRHQRRGSLWKALADEALPLGTIP